MKKYDFVKVISVPAKDLDCLIGEEGMIIEVDRGSEYPYEVAFFSKNAQIKSLEEGGLIWKDYNLEVF